MEPLHIEAICTKDGVITLRDLPVHEGDLVEIVVIPRSSATHSAQERFPLRGEPIEYLRPFEPAAEGDWEATR